MEEGGRIQGGGSRGRVLRRKGKEAAERGPRTAEEEDRRVCGGGPAGVVTNGDVRALSAQPCRVGDYLHKYCLQKAIIKLELSLQQSMKGLHLIVKLS